MSRLKSVVVLLFFSTVFIFNLSCSRKDNITDIKTTRLNLHTASNFANLALKCIHKEYPNKLSHVMNNVSEVKSPKSLHPAFYGCFDWHSCVHGHWMLIRLLKMFPELPEAEKIRKSISVNLTKEKIEKEVKYLHEPGRKSFERMYGWAWLLKLSEELIGWDDPDGRTWKNNLDPLTREIVKKYMDFLPKQTYPVRTGVHPNTAFALEFGLDYARAAKDKKLEEMIIKRSLDYYKNDINCPGKWEPGGEDFFSPCLIEADLLRRILPEKNFSEWLYKFLPGIEKEKPKSLFYPAVVGDRSDPKIVHLDGLNLSRAWCLKGIALSLPANDKRRNILLEAAKRHAKDALSNVASGNYEGEHWLASFAVYMMSVTN